MRYRFVLCMLLALCSFILVGALSFPSGPAINYGTTVYTYDNLVCRWTASGDATNVTVAWFQDGSPFLSNTYNGTLPTNSTIGSGNTTRDEEWICNITLFNATNSLSLKTNLTIENAAPLTPTIFDSGLAIDSKNITEDVVFTLDMNSSDADNDTLTYYLLESKFCTVTDSGTGAISCNATHDYVNESDTNQSESVQAVSVEFWARDTAPNTKSSSKTIVFNITPVNDAPVLTITGQTSLVTAVYNETFTAIDEEENYPLTAVLNSGATSSDISDDVTVTVESDATVRITYQTSPTEYDDWGNHTVSFNLSDNNNATVTVNFTLEITKVNQPPYFTNISPSNYSSPVNRTYVLAQGDTIIINLSANDPDTPDRNETLSFSDNSTRMATTTINPNATNSSDATGRITFTPGPADVGNYSITIQVEDQESDSSTIELNFSVSNINDAPVINHLSYYNNTAGNINITTLSAYLSTPFYYRINYSDYDEIHGDTFTWSDNTTRFNVSATGIISFTPSGLPGNETITITIEDSGGLRDTVIINLEVFNNSAPYFNQTLPNLTCYEGTNCFFNVSYYAKDDDGDNISEYSATNTTVPLNSFSINDSTGLINFTPLQSEIGNYTYQLRIEDAPGAFDTENLNIEIVNTEDTPIWDSSADFSSQTIVEDHEFSHYLRASDADFLLTNSTEQLTITTNISWINISTGSTTNDTYIALLQFLPNATTVGTHSILLNVTDSTNRSNVTTFNFTVLADTLPPSIEYITPYGNDVSSDQPVYSWLDVSLLTTDNLRILENQSYTFEVNASDPETSASNLQWEWSYDGVVVLSGTGNTYKNYTRLIAFNESGWHNLTVTVQDETLNTDSFSWLLTVVNVNRAPVLEGNLSSNITVTTDTTLQDYFLLINLASPKGFLDPDDDIDASGKIDGVESQNLNYSATACSNADLTFENDDLIISPLTVGECLVTFNATDADGLSAESNLVRIYVSEVPEGAQVPVASSSSGGSSSSSSTFVPLETEVESPEPLTIITPQLVTIYKNRTVVVPILLENNWSSSLEGIRIGASTNASNVQLSLDSNYVEELATNDTEDIFLKVTGYRLGENFEVTVTANVTDPSFKDTALILFNSIESAQDGEDVEVKVTFAQDLLNQNQECQELNELLSEANEHLKKGQLDEAHTMVDLVINGCKYLLSKTQETQRPGVVRTPWIELKEDTVKFVSFILLGAFIIIGMISLVFYHYKTKEEYDF